ncbi:MAG: rRNA m(7)G-527 methyltransferase [Clostridiales bacterium]|nr:rRNA m(7)G-527 methyltransferase [Clostridiales bacterium]
MDNLRELLKQGSNEFSVIIEDEKIEKLLRYKEILMEWNEKVNLTAIEEDREIIIKHFIDSISIVPSIKNPASKIIDVGTGAGFPGIPLKVAVEGLDVTLLDSLDKRVKFLDEVILQLGLKGIRTIHGRAEDFGIKSDYREKFDIAVARAVANLPVLLEYCLPFVKQDGIFIAMKGSNTVEVQESKKALEILGGKIEEVKEFTLPFSDHKRNVILIRKLRQTPTKYPRKAGKPTKEPLI